MTTIVPRDIDVDFSRVPRYWLGGNAFATAVSNGLNLLFPAGERFFVRSVNKLLDRVSDRVLLAQVKGFFGQEGRHARAHDRFNEVMREHGYAIDDFLARYEAIASWIEKRVPAKLNLAATAASEHYTAILAEGAFTQQILDACAPEMKRLLAWHAAEEIEHRAVAFDVLRAVDPSYALRMAGLVHATVMLGAFWIWAAITLLRQDGMTLADARQSARAMPSDPIIRRVFLRGIREYIRRDFHPSHKDLDKVAEQWFAARGIAMPEAA